MRKPTDLQPVSNVGTKTFPWVQPINKWLVPLVVVVIVAIVGFFTQAAVEKAIKNDLAGELQVILEADVAALQIWLEAQKKAVEAIIAEPEVTADIENLIALTREIGVYAVALRVSQPLRSLRATLGPHCRVHGYTDFLVIEPGGTNLGALQNEPIGQKTVVGRSNFLSQALAGNTVVSKPFQDALRLPGENRILRPKKPTMFVAAPVYNRYGQIIAVLGLRIQPEKDFTRILRVARAGESGETYAFDDQGLMISYSRFDEHLRQIGLMNDESLVHSILKVEIRDPGGNMLEGYRPVPRDQQPLTRMAKSAISGKSGVDVNGYRDYRGVPVVGAWTWLPEYDFGVATEADMAEAFRPLRLLHYSFVAIIGLLLLAILGFVISTRIIYLERRRMQKLGQYTLEKKIGKGGLGAVYKANHAMLRRPTALKLLRPEHSSEEDIARFEREVQFASQLTHPNTIRIYDYGRTPEGLFYYAMEYLPGINLYNLADKYGPQPEARVIHILLQVCASLEEAHCVGLIHRDIKPENVILCERGGDYDVAKVLDFGLVKYISKEGKSAEDSRKTAVGTPQYLAPEAILTPEKVDERTDIYAIGAVAYYLLTGSDVFHGKSPIQVCQKQIYDPPEPPSKRLGRAISQDLEKVILLCLEKEPGQRPQDSSVLIEMLKDCRDYGKWTQAEAAAVWDKHQKASFDLGDLGEPMPRGPESRVSVDLGERIKRFQESEIQSVVRCRH
jgi:hypothetical protein